MEAAATRAAAGTAEPEWRAGYLIWRRSWAGRRYERQERQRRHKSEVGRAERLAIKRQARQAERDKHAAERGHGCRHVLTVWETVSHHRYPGRPALAHRVPFGRVCARPGEHATHWTDPPRRWW